MKLSDWAKQNGVSYKTAYRWFHAGQLPDPSRQLPSGTILVDVYDQQDSASTLAVVYARVSSHDQKGDLQRQVSRLTEWATGNAVSVDKVVTEIGSGLNGKRSKLLRLLKNQKVATIIVEHRDRLARFGAEMVEACLSASGRRLLIVDKGEIKDDLVQDMTDVLTSLCARLYGRRSARNRAKKAMRVIREDH